MRDDVWALVSLVAAVGVIRLMIIGVVAFAKGTSAAAERGRAACSGLGTRCVDDPSQSGMV